APGSGLQAACRKLKDEGYFLVVDYYDSDGNVSPLSELADIARVDFLTAGRKEREAIRLTAAANQRIKFLADKLETREDFEQALKLGYSYFQGYFFSKPLTVAGKDIPSYKLTYFRILQEINRPDMDFGRIEKLIKRDVALSYKLLKFINSLSFGFISEIRSIRQALTILGQKGITRWATLLALKSMGANKPDELLVLAVCRGKFCELVAPHVGLKDRSCDLFLLGMFSLIDAFLDQPMAVVMQELPIADDIKRALLGEEGGLRDVYELIVAYEKGDWSNFSRLASKLNLEEERAAAFYLSSLKLANRIFTPKGWEPEETDWI
ncbi:MAG TPA: HDOD domain-containing protein, partial [Firmicutes bacterium]|nr:HDOD domain-containing protein [Bacillota bacterium]